MGGPIANTSVPAAPYLGTPLGYQQITGINTGTNATLTVPAGARFALITAEAEAVRYRDDGTNPTSAVGMPLAVGATLTYTGNLSALVFNAQVNGATLDILYYG